MPTYTFFTKYLDNSSICQCTGENSIEAVEMWSNYIVKEKGFRRIKYEKLKQKLSTLRMHKIFNNVCRFRVTVSDAPIFVYFIKTSDERDQLDYVDEDAVEVTCANLPKELKLKFEIEDVSLILDLKFQYLLEIGYYTEKPIPDDEPDPFENYEWDMDAICGYVIEKAAKQDKYFIKSDLDKVFDAEEVYMKEIGIIEEDGLMKIMHLPINPN